MSIVLARVDDRLVHGQVVEGWVPHVAADTIVVANDAIYRDQNRRRLLALVVPDRLELEIVEMVNLDALLKDRDASKNLVLFEDLTDVFAARESGVPLRRINLGNLHHVRGGVEVTPSVFLNRKDIELIHNLSKTGVAVEARDVPGGRSLNVMDFLTKIEGLV